MFSKTIKINNNIIGGERTFIIAEIGSNHNQDINRAYELIDIAVESGADAVKFQSIKADKLVRLDEIDMKTKEVLKKIELKEEWYGSISKYCESKCIPFFSSPTYLEAVELLVKNNVKLMKIASPQTYGFPELIRQVGKTELPTIMSIGYCNYSEIERAVNVFRETNNKNLILLHCSSNYPTPFDQVNLNFIPTLKDMFGTIVGFSDHTSGISIPIAAVSKGATVIEKHLTISKYEEGPDHFFAIEPNEFKSMVDSIRDIESAFGKKSKQKLSKFEIEFRDEIEMKIVLNKSLEKGEIVSKDHINYLRTKNGVGVSAWKESDIIGKRIKKNIEKNTFIEFSDLY